jgi:hypothetical protein
MKSTLLAVFGHYDSRGGTMAIPITTATTEEMEKAKGRYNTECGRGSGEPDYAENDFRFVAELHHPDHEIIQGDLEDRGIVLIDETTEPGRPDGVPSERILKWHTEEAKVLTQLEFVPLDKALRDIVIAVGGSGVVGTLAIVLDKSKARYRSWNDDAFGFYVVAE